MSAIETTAPFPILTALVLLPAVAALALQLAPSDRAASRVALAAMAAELVIAAGVLLGFRPALAQTQFAERVEWIPTIGAVYHVGVDGLSVLFLPLTALTALLALVSSWRGVRYHPRGFLASLLLLEAATMGIFVSLDLLLFFLFWEAMLVPTYALIRVWGVGPERQAAAAKYALYMLVGSAPMLVAIALLGINARAAAAAGPGGYTFDLPALLAVPVPPGLQLVVFFAFAFSFAVKSPLFPFHSWLPGALLEGPAGVAIFLVGLKLGIYGFLRFAIPLAPDAAREWGWAVAALGVASILYGGLVALTQPNLRRLLAFAALTHVGLATVGVFSLNQQGVQGALLLMVNVAVSATGLALLAGALHARLGSTELTSLGGLARYAPRLAAAFLVFGLAGIGLPGTSGFPAELLVFIGAFRAQPPLAALALLGAILGAAYFLSFFERAFLGPATREAVRTIRDLRPREAAAAAVLATAILAVGAFPGPLLEITDEAARALVQRVESRPAAAR